MITKEKLKLIKLNRLCQLNPSYPYILNILLNMEKVKTYNKSKYDFYKYNNEYVLYVDNEFKNIHIKTQIWDYNNKRYFYTKNDFLYIFDNIIIDKHLIGYNCTYDEINDQKIRDLMLTEIASRTLKKIGLFVFLEKIKTHILFRKVKKV